MNTTKKKLWPGEEGFLRRLMELAPEVCGSFYFNQSHEKIILESGFLLSCLQREERFGPGESKTTEKNKEELGNHDHVFFFLETVNQPFKRTRFAQPSSEQGKASAPRKKDVATGDERRISIPLAELMRSGTWAMSKDFLGVDRTDKNYENLSRIPQKYNFIDGGTGELSRLSRAQYLLRGLGLTAIARMRSMKNETARKQMLAVEGEELLDVVTRQVLSPQLMVPGGVSLHVPGATLDRAEPGTPFSSRKRFGE